MQVRCYWNLHKSCWSVQDAKTRRVVGHADKVLLREARFTVSQAGRARVLEEGRKNVHAFACGELHGAKWLEYGRNTDAMLFDWSPGDRAYERAAGRLGRFVSYNPRVDETFVEVSLNSPVRKPRREAPMALLTRTRLPSKPHRAAMLVFDPCDMTDEESRAATV